ncbi:hypothetical protein G6F59_017328 [Rhizopus arrhizus]|nr:hypothetical protein G6F59_017328 [Rhizopus arrhizus]
MQRQERTNRQFCGFELGIERSITVQLALRCQLRDLATAATFGTHAAAVERLQCTAVAPAGHVSAAETACALPRLRGCAPQAEADPAQLRTGKTERGIVLQCGRRTLRGGAQFERIGADRGRGVQQLPQLCLSGCSGHCGRPLHA